MILDGYSILFFFNFILKISSLILNLEDSLVDITTTDAWLMTVLWPENGKLTWLAGNERLRFHTRILGYILSLVIFHFRKISKRSIAISLLVVKRNLNIQIPLDNEETYGYTPLADLPEVEYNEAKDVTKYPGVKAQTLVTCKPGQFAIFWPQDGHQPCIGSGDIHKAIFKIKN